MIRTLIVDDETPARDKLRRWLGEHPDVAVVAEAADGLSAAEAIAALHPDVVYLDIQMLGQMLGQMPGLSGLEVAAQLEPDRAPLIVFVTAYDEHAVRAFDLNAVDYLLKPYDKERLLRTLARVRERLALASRSAAVRTARSWRLMLPFVAGVFLIVPPQVWYERLFRQQWQGGYLDFLLHRVLQFQPYPQGDFSWHHLWFILYLYVYVWLLLPLLLYWRRRSFVLRPGPWLYLLALPLGLNEVLLKPLFPESHRLVGDWYVFNHYLMLTLYGVALASMAGSWDWIASRRHRSLGLGIAVFAIAMILIEFEVLQRDGAADAMIANVFTWCWVLVFLGYGRCHLSFSSGLLRWARDASYPIYILHQTIIVAIGYYVIQMPWGAVEEICRSAGRHVGRVRAAV